jgi:hypothetical protein
LLKELKQGNNRSKWIKREPYAYWKGNPFVAETRRDLLKCNLSYTHDWNARLYIQVISNKLGSSTIIASKFHTIRILQRERRVEELTALNK